MRCLFVALLLCLAGPAAAETRAAAAPFETTDLEGKRIAIKDFQGKPLIVTFWATWCVPCKKAIPYIDGLVEKHGAEKLGALAISIDDSRTQSQVRGTAKRYKWALPVAIDQNGDIATALNPRGLAPYTLFIDREGRIAHAREGFAPGDEKLFDEWAAKLLAEAPPAK